MKNFKKLFATVLSLCMFLSSIYSVQTFSYNDSQNRNFCFNFKELDKVFEENKLESTKNIIDEINRCNDNIKNLNNNFNFLIACNAAKCGFITFVGALLGYFVYKFSSFQKSCNSNKQQINSSKVNLKKRSQISTCIGALVGGLISSTCLFFTSQNSISQKEEKILQEEANRKQLIEKFKDAVESNKRKKCILNELLTYLEHKRFIDFLAPQEEISERGTEFCAQLSKFEPKQCRLYLENNERIIYTEDEKKSFPKYFEKLAKKIKKHLGEHHIDLACQSTNTPN